MKQEQIEGSVLTARWYPLNPHPKQIALAKTQKRFACVVAGRRSGKTEVGKRTTVREALATKVKGWHGVLAAPTRAQAKKIFWADLKALVPRWAMAGKPLEAELTIRLINSATISVVGMDSPDRIEGVPLDWFWGDEYGNMKESAWMENIRPALATMGRPGKARFSGVPEDRNHFYDMFKHSQDPNNAVEWDSFHWPSSEVIDPEELASACAGMDPLMFDREFNANFVNFEGRAYYCFDREKHAKERVRYRPGLPLIACFDFNNKPGVCAIVQEQDGFTCAIGEVWIPVNSNTQLVARKLATDWAGVHTSGDIHLYGDATGGAKTTTAVSGSDWDILDDVLRPVFGSRLKFRVGKSNPPERVRVNAVNARLQTADGKLHCKFDPMGAAHLIDDLDSVTTVEGGSGELDKRTNKMATHISDALGYYVADRFPLVTSSFSTSIIY